MSTGYPQIDWDAPAEANRRVIETYAKNGGKLKSARNLTRFIVMKAKAASENREPTKAELALCDDLSIEPKAGG